MIPSSNPSNRSDRSDYNASKEVPRVVVIGAGASGMVAATQAAKRGCRVILLEKNSKTGVKILMSGGTRCNVTHDTDARGITNAFGHAKRFLQPSVGQFPPSEVVNMFTLAGVETKVESTGKIFPRSDRAVHVRDALHQMAVEAGVEIRLRSGVNDVCRHSETGAHRWNVITDDQSIPAAAVIVTAGGRSWPGCGTTGDAYQWLERLGHTIVRPRPALVPLVGGAKWTRALSGITLEDCVATVREKNERGEIKMGRKGILLTRRSSLLLTHFGFSGPAAMDVSGVMTMARSMDDVQLQLDLVPGESEQQLEELFTRGHSQSGENQSRRKVSSIVNQFLPQRLGDAIVHHLGDDPMVSQLPGKMRRQLIAHLKHLSVPITGTKGFEKAEVTAGGVALNEVHPKTMKSRIQKDLFIAGEVLDVDGWIGGYNFQAAFSTGHAAGTAAAEMMNDH